MGKRFGDQRMAAARRRADRNRRNAGHRSCHFADRAKASDALRRVMRCDGGSQFELAAGSEGGNVLVSGNLSDAHKGDTGSGHLS